ncbi:MAG: hypothetical protein J5537_02190 [Lachnospiraceae bacterium]|nr:hypothetical protein [Lachnospiraceae bacterium]
MKRLLSVLFIIIFACALMACTTVSESTERNGMDTEIVSVIQADYPSYESAKDMVNAADLIFSGKIKNSKSEFLDVKTEKGKDRETGLEKSTAIPYTIYEISVSKIYLGNKDEAVIYIKCPGGTIDNKTFVSEATERLRPDVEYLFLAKTFENSYPSLINDTQSFYDMSAKDNGVLMDIMKIIE